ncbi:MAG: hypothetical protein IAB78_02635 [Bacteroidetes bacterium]|uniref:Uncharacterized protein n=1 Tax=Candidatus Cryptobacteroides excrementavium TaxID=2840759 RepID=A0A9D9J3A9_9BACT|nr:hypothetical protein [Candidatus Cryptobacteroides excrementavium]
MEKEFSRVHSATDITVSVILLAAGCVLVAMPTSVPVNILGFFLIITGLVLALVLRTGYKDKETGERFRKKERFFPAHCKDSISKALASSPDNIDFNEENKGNGLRLDTWYNSKTGHVFVRLYEYIPYRYQPCTAVIATDMEKAGKLTR